METWTKIWLEVQNYNDYYDIKPIFRDWDTKMCSQTHLFSWKGVNLTYFIWVFSMINLVFHVNAMSINVWKVDENEVREGFKKWNFPPILSAATHTIMSAVTWFCLLSRCLCRCLRWPQGKGGMNHDSIFHNRRICYELYS